MRIISRAALILVVWCGVALAAAVAQTETDDRLILPPMPDDTPDIASTACGQLIIAKEQGETLFWASDVFECLSNVPFIPDVASRFIRYYNQTLQFQSTLAYLKDPPEGYQQPPVDVVAELGLLQEQVATGKYTTQYAFEADLQLLINRIHDDHVYLSAGLLAPFAFVSPFGLVSASRDGKEIPSVYFKEEVVLGQLQGWEPSPITHINNIDVVEYLSSFAEINSEGYLEPHADWNALFENPALDIQFYQSTLHAAMFYPGDALNFTQGNGTITSTYWLAIYSEAQHTGPLTTAGDFYNYFVLGLLPDNWDSTNAQWWPDLQETPGSSEDDGSSDLSISDIICNVGGSSEANWCKESQGAYPSDPDFAQADLSRLKGGVLTGYFLNDTTGVLSIPSFWQQGNDTRNFFQVIDQFIGNATKKNISRVVIDLQQNRGGMPLLALSIFKRFFYDQEPWTGSRIRTHDAANTMGAAYSAWWDSLETQDDGALDPNYRYFASSEWVVTNRINPATGVNYSSWDEYAGPVLNRGDKFSNPQLYNLSDQVFDITGFQGWVPFGYGISTPKVSPAIWAPENIVLLTDGLCSSACAYFVELMKYQAGVKTVVVGGRPTTGPMQTASGTRGARLYSSEALDYDFTNVNDTLEDHDAYESLPARDVAGMWINFAGFNIRDQVRNHEEEAVPVQFLYEAADCRMYYTLSNIYNLTQLWYDAVAAAWDHPSLCVEDSTGYSNRKSTNSPKPPPARTAQAPTFNLDHVSFSDRIINTTVTLVDTKTKESISSIDITQCFHLERECGGTLQCRDFTVDCRGDGTVFRSIAACLPDATNYGAACGEGMDFMPTTDAESKRNLPRKKVGGGKFALYEPVIVSNGFCVPIYPNLAKFRPGCPVY